MGFDVSRLDGLDELPLTAGDRGLGYDLVIVDSVDGLAKQPAIGQRFLVLTPSPTVLARNKVLLGSPVSDGSLYVVLNRVGEVKWRELLSDEMRHLYESGRLFEVPYDPNVIVSERSHELTLVKYPRTAFSIAVLRLATFVGGLDYQPPPVRRRRIWGRHIDQIRGILASRRGGDER